jgi:hypothetical protein
MWHVEDHAPKRRGGATTQALGQGSFIFISFYHAFHPPPVAPHAHPFRPGGTCLNGRGCDVT